MNTHKKLKSCAKKTESCFLTLYGCCCGCDSHPSTKSRFGVAESEQITDNL